MKRIVWTLMIVAGLGVMGPERARAWTDMAYRGNLNGFGTTALTYENGIWRGTIEYTAASGSADAFKLYASDGGTWFGNGQSWSHPDAQTVATVGGDMDLNGVNGNYYTFTAIDASSLAMAVQETASTPVTIQSFSSEVADGGSFDGADVYAASAIQNNVNTVDVTLDNAPSAGENVYIYYSTDGFASQANSDVVQASGAGTGWSANIAAQSEGTTVDYYVLTSTFSEGNLDSVGAEIDVLLRGLDETSGSSQSFSIYDLGDAFHIQTQTAGGAGETMLAGSGGTLSDWLGTETEARIYSGNIFQTTGESADQSGYTLHYQIDNGAWQTAVGGFDNTSVNDKYWEAAIDLTTVSSGSVVRYYLEVDYSLGTTPNVETTYVYANGLGSYLTGNQTLAQDNAYTFNYGEAGGGGGGAVPEPSVINLALMAGVIGFAVRRRLRRTTGAEVRNDPPV